MEITKGLKKRCIVLGASRGEYYFGLREIIRPDDYIICADGGLNYAEMLDIVPDCIIGDFDSYSGSLPYGSPTIKLPTHKDDTDLHYAVLSALKGGFDSFVLSGVTGGRLDHTIATFSTARYLLNTNAQVSIYEKKHIALFTKSSITLKRPEYECYVSVFPLDKNASGVNISGAEYNLDNAELNKDFPLGISNSFKSDFINISVKSGELLILIVKK